ncbi:hypothetical protein HDU98_007405, partial [Podochytrium sp. JEL0797]
MPPQTAATGAAACLPPPGLMPTIRWRSSDQDDVAAAATSWHCHHAYIVPSTLIQHAFANIAYDPCTQYGDLNSGDDGGAIFTSSPSINRSYSDSPDQKARLKRSTVGGVYVGVEGNANVAVGVGCVGVGGEEDGEGLEKGEIGYTLQTFKKATVVGTNSRGGAHPGQSFWIHPNAFIFISIGLNVNTLTKSDWESNNGSEPNGVVPDVCVANGTDAKSVAYKLALENVVQKVDKVPSNQKFLDKCASALEGLAVEMKNASLRDALNVPAAKQWIKTTTTTCVSIKKKGQETLETRTQTADIQKVYNCGAVSAKENVAFDFKILGVNMSAICPRLTATAAHSNGVSALCFDNGRLFSASKDASIK